MLYLFRSSETDTPHLPAVTNRDVLELVFTLRKDSEKLPVIPRLHDYMIGNSFIPSQTSQKCLWKKVNDTENQFAQLKKNHNAHCMREGSHQVEKLNNYLDNAFYGHLKSTKKQQTSHSTSTDSMDMETVCDIVTSTNATVLESTISSTNPYAGTSTVKTSNAEVQVSSPQIKTEGQLHREKRRVRRQLSFRKDEVEKLKQKFDKKDLKLVQSEMKRQQAQRALKDKREQMAELNNRCKQLTANNQQSKSVVKAKAKSDQVLQKSQAVIAELLDENNELELSVNKLSDTLTDQKKKTRKLQQHVSKLKIDKEKVQQSINQLCTKIESGENVEKCVGQICEEVSSLGGNVGIMKSLAEAMTSTVHVKHKNVYADHVTLLMMELQNLGVTQSSVGKVANACLKHLCGREMDSVVSRRTAGRMVRRGGILADVQVATELTENSTRGLRIGQDTTTRRGTEHVSTVWGIRKDDGSVRYLQSRVQWLPNHTADEQSKHILNHLEKCNEILDQMDIPTEKKLSVINIVEFIGDHINGKLHKNLETEHLQKLQELVRSNDITDDEREPLQYLYKSACQQHSCAKVSHSFFEGMQKEKPEDLAKCIGKHGLQQKKGRTYEAAASKVIETASVQLSPDYANTSTTDFNWADVYQGWCDANHREYHRIGYVNKNRHYRHEYEACNIIKSSQNIVDFYTSRKTTRDDANDHQTLRNRDQIVYER